MTRPRTIPLLLVALLLLAAPVAAGEVWEKQIGSSITAVATDERGDLIFVGTEGGMVYCYNSAGSVVWSQTLGGEVVALEVDGAADYLLVEIGDGTRIESRDPETGAYRWDQPSNSPRHITLSQAEGISANTLAGDTLRLRDGDGNAWSHISIGTTTDLAISGDASWVVSSSGSDLKLYALSVPEADEWLLSGTWAPYHNRAAHTIVGSTDGALTNYPVEITVIRGTGTSSGSTLYAPECRADFADIRFTAADGVTQIPYYLESVVGSTATFLVNVPSNPASPGTTTIYVYWANPAATTTTSDPDAGRYTLDDFSGTSLNTDIWETFGNATITVADGKLTITGDNIGYSGVRSKSTYNTGVVEVNAMVEGDLGSQGAFWIGFFGDGQVPNSVATELDVTLNRAAFTSWDMPQQLHGSTADGSARANYLFGGRLWGYNDYRVEWNGASAVMQAGAYGEQTLASAPTTNCTIMLAIGDTSPAYGGVTMIVDEVTIVSSANTPALPGAWGPVESIVTHLDTKTLGGTITNIDAPETGDWVAVSTTTKTYIIEITDSGFGAVYSADRTGTPYDLAVADGGSFVIEGRNILADIFRIDGVQVGTYTTGGAVQHVAIAQKNGLYAAAGSDDGKYYVFSKDASSSWYLLLASDTYDPVTALAMSWRGELLIVGRADGRLTAFQVSEQDATGAIRVTIYKDNIPYATAPLRIEDGGTDQSWGAPTTLTTDDYGIVSIPVSWGNYIRITVGDDELTRVLIATPSQTEYVLRITGPDPLRTGAQYSSGYDPDTQRIYLHYADPREKTHRVVYTIVRAADNAVVFEREYTDADLPLTDYYQIPAGWTNTSYRIHLTASGSPSFTNTWSQWVGVDGVAKLPAVLDNYMKMGICFFLLLFVAGLFSYLTGPQGAVVVSMLAGALVLWGWLPLPPTIIALCIVWAFLGLLGRTSGE